MLDKTELLIAKLVERHTQVRPFMITPLLWAGVLLLVAIAVLFILPLGIRPEWRGAAWFKSAGLLVLLLGVLQFLWLYSGPAIPQKKALVVAVMTLLLGGLSLVGMHVTGEALSLRDATRVPSFWGCIAWIVGIGFINMLVLQRVLRRARPARGGIFRMLVASCAVLISATVYSFHCPVDALSYLATAYLLAAGVVVSVGYALGQRLWHWR